MNSKSKEVNIMKRSFTHFAIIFVLLSSSVVFPRGFRPGQIPNGTVNSCENCHVDPSGGGERNQFGKLVEARFLVSGNVNWGPLLASLDADNDGVTNGEELQDPFGLWTTGLPAPGNSSLISLPGSASSNKLSMLTVTFSGMTPHVGQKLFLRVVDKLNMMEVGRTEVPSITASFNVQLNVVLPGHSFYVDFFADHNNNGLYNAPPVDHSWRMELNNAVGNDQLNFSHNTNFTDIKWPYLLTVQFSGMTPHLGQLLELRVEDNLTGKEVGRKRIETLNQAAFNISLPGIELGKEYKVEFYADHNKNGLYNAPPTDHAWELKFENNSGDFILPFSHNTNFKDINWKYLYTLNLSNMTPHLNQLFQLRVVRNDNGEEIERAVLAAILGASYSVSIPGIEIGHDYRADFFADHNGSGQYEAPPADHAWRLTFNSSTGNFVQNFTHNTNFTDIQWPNATDVSENINTLNPDDYKLAQNFPNPFNPSTKISWQSPVSSRQVLKIFDVLGNETATLVDEELGAGYHSIDFNASELPSGVYFYRIQAGNFIDTKKMILLR